MNRAASKDKISSSSDSDIDAEIIGLDDPQQEEEAITRREKNNQFKFNLFAALGPK